MTNNIGAGGKNKTRGGRKTKKKGTKKKEGGGYFFSSPEQKLQQKSYELRDAVVDEKKDRIRKEMQELLLQIPQEKRNEYSILISHGGIKTKRRTNNKRKTAKKNNKKKQ